jgi:hypothetical protein
MCGHGKNSVIVRAGHILRASEKEMLKLFECKKKVLREE